MPEERDINTESLPDIPPRVVAAYESNENLLVKEVNKALTEREDLDELIGDNPIGVMEDNHHNHARFMTNCFRLNDFQLLVRTIPWVYRAYYHHGFSYDYFPVELRLWIKAVEEHLPPPKAGPIKEVYSFILEHHQKFVELSQRPSSSEPIKNSRWQETADRFLHALLDGDHRSALEIVKQEVDSKRKVSGFFEKVIKPSMYEVGKMWELGEISVAEEHLASSIVSRILSVLYSRFITFEEVKGKAVIAAVANEFHEIGSRVVADSLELAGWDVDHLGVNTPIHDLVDLVSAKQPEFVGLSVAVPFNLDQAIETIEAIRSRVNLSETKLLVGGKSFNDNPQLWKKIGADAWSQSGPEAVKLADEWLRQI